MKLIHKHFRILGIVLLFSSCLVPPAPKHHNYKPQTDNYENAPRLGVFSTPRIKNYFLGNVNLNDEVYIKSNIFENPQEYYIMNNSDHFGKEVKAFDLIIRDSKFYKNPDFRKVSIKIISESGQKIIDYILVKN